MNQSFNRSSTSQPIPMVGSHDHNNSLLAFQIAANNNNRNNLINQHRSINKLSSSLSSSTVTANSTNPKVFNQSIASSSLSNNNGGSLSSAEKRANHNAIERARRELFNVRFQDLANLVPTLSRSRKPSKSLVVQKATEYIMELAKKTEKQQQLIQLYQMKTDALTEEINRLTHVYGKNNNNNNVGADGLKNIEDRHQQINKEIEILHGLMTAPTTPIVPSTSSTKISALSQALSSASTTTSNNTTGIATSTMSPSLNTMDPEEEDDDFGFNTPFLQNQQLSATAPTATTLDDFLKNALNDSNPSHLDQMIDDELMITTNDLHLGDDPLLQSILSPLSSSQSSLSTSIPQSFNHLSALPRIMTQGLVPNTPINTPLTGSSLTSNHLQQQQQAALLQLAALQQPAVNINVLQSRRGMDQFSGWNGMTHSLPNF